MNANKNYQPDTWLCGDGRVNYRNSKGRIIFRDPLGLEVRAPKTPMEMVSVDVVDEFLFRAGVKVK